MNHQNHRVSSWGRLLVALAVAMLGSGALSPAIRAQMLVDRILTGGVPMGWNNRTVGYDFTVSSTDPVVITSVGIWDQGGDGLSESHEIGIWAQRSPFDIRLVFSTTIPAGTPGVLGWDDFRFIDIPPLALDPAPWYFLGAHYTTSADPVLKNVTYARIGGPFSFGGARVSESNGWGIPKQQVGEYDIGLFGPNLAIGVVPEPGGWLVTVTGVLLLLAAVRRRVSARS